MKSLIGYNSVADIMGLSSLVSRRCWLPNSRNQAKFRQNVNLQATAVQGHPMLSILVSIESAFFIVTNINFARRA